MREIENLSTGVRNTWNALTKDSDKSLYFDQNVLETGERNRSVLSLSSSVNEREIKSHVNYEEVKQPAEEGNGTVYLCYVVQRICFKRLTSQRKCSVIVIVCTQFGSPWGDISSY